MNTATNKMMPPSLDALMIGYLSRSEDSEALVQAMSEMGDVEPHEVSVGYRSEPRQAWKESLSLLPLFGMAELNLAAPSDWTSLVLRSEPVSALPMALGNYPQRVRDLSTLLSRNDLSTLVTRQPSKPAMKSLRSWAEKMAAENIEKAIVALGVLRMAGDLNFAEELCVQLRNRASEETKSAIENEQAAILWQQGKSEAALSIWRELPASMPVLFNRGMAALFTNQRSEARECLNQVVAQMSDENPWHHLAGLYLAIAEMA